MTYTDYWNLSEIPFQNVADARYVFLSDQHQEGLARLMYLVSNRKAGGVLTGPYGVGKSMVLHLLVQQVQVGEGMRIVLLDYLPGNALALLRQILDAAGHPCEPFADMHTMMNHLRRFRLDHANGDHVAIAIDEAQLISDVGVCQALHLIMNMTVDGLAGRPPRPAFTLLMAGYADVTRILSQDPSLCQRVQLVWPLDPLTRDQTVQYIGHRMSVAGGDLTAFDAAALDVIYESSQGIPRVINSLSDVALMLGCAAGATCVTRELAVQTVADVQFSWDRHGA